MDVNLSHQHRGDPQALATASLIEKCVHCGFCSAACPTYGLEQDERDSPRGRIYLVKELLEGIGDEKTVATHLDRCLTCRACETACPSGVEYARIAHYGRHKAQLASPPSWRGKTLRHAIGLLVRSRLATRLGANAARLAGKFAPTWLQRALAPALPLLPLPQKLPTSKGQVVRIISGCAQQGLMPSSNEALARLFRLAGLNPKAISAPKCCGALAYHMGDREKARANIKQVLAHCASDQPDAPLVMAASGCASFIREYPVLDVVDEEDLPQARKLAQLVADPATLLTKHGDALARHLSGTGQNRRVTVHAPCTQVNGMRTPSTTVPNLLQLAGFIPLAPPNPTSCCGSAGAYSLLQPAIAKRLRSAMTDNLASPGGEMIASSNIGCILHLRQDTSLPVHHWADLLMSINEN